MKFGLLYEIEAPRPWKQASLAHGFNQALEQVKIAEEAGFHSVWSLEQPFPEPFAMAAAPEMWLAAVAQHTEHMRIGYGARLAPFEYSNPIRLAEMAAVLDIMSQGRLDFGTGPTAALDELRSVPGGLAETRGPCDEALRMIPRMWVEDEFSWDSDGFKMPPRNVWPKPVQDPHPPVWMSGHEPDSAARAGELGIGFMHGWPSDPAGLGQAAGRYRETIEMAGSVGSMVNEQFAACTALFCGADDAQAVARAGEAVCSDRHFIEAVRELEAVHAALEDQSGDGVSYEACVKRWQERKEDTQGCSLNELLEQHAAIVGGPETCAQSIEWFESHGVDLLLFSVQLGSLPHDDVCDSLRRFGREVMPRFDR